MVRKFWEDITLPGYRRIVAEIAPGKPAEAMRRASKFFRDNGYQSRPTQVHGIDLVTDKPHVVAEHVSAEKFEEVLKSGMVIMAEPNPITADGLFGIFLGHTFIVTENGHERSTIFRWRLRWLRRQTPSPLGVSCTLASPRHQKLEIAPLVSAEDLFGEKLGVAAIGDRGLRRCGGCALFQLGLIDQKLDAARLDREPDAVAAANKTERAAGGGVGRDVQHDGAEGGAAHAGV